MDQLSRRFTYRLRSHGGVLQPQGQRPWFGLFRFRSPLLTESHSFSFPPVTEMFHFTGYCVSFPILFRKERYRIKGIRLPHSEISGSTLVCSSPKLIAAYHVLHRLLAPRHPLYALNNLIPFLEIEQTDTVRMTASASSADLAIPPTKLPYLIINLVEYFQELQDKLK